MVPLKELQEAGLGACGSLYAAETQVVARTLQVAHVHGQILQPQTGPLSHGGQLGRPASGTGEGKRKKRRQHFQDLLCKNLQREMRHKRGASAAPLRPRPDSLVVRESKRWQVGVLLRKVCQSVDHSRQL